MSNADNNGYSVSNRDSNWRMKPYFINLKCVPLTCCVSNSGELVAVGGYAHGFNIFVYTIDYDKIYSKHKTEVVLKHHNDSITYIKFLQFNNNLYLISTSKDGTCVIIDMKTYHKFIHQLKIQGCYVTQFIAFDYKQFVYLFCATSDAYVVIYDVISGKQICKTKMKTMKIVESIDISPNGSHLVVGGIDYDNIDRHSDSKNNNKNKNKNKSNNQNNKGIINVYKIIGLQQNDNENDSQQQLQLTLRFEQDTVMQFTPLQVRFIDDNFLMYQNRNNIYWVKIDLNRQNQQSQLDTYGDRKCIWKCEKGMFNGMHSSQIQCLQVYNDNLQNNSFLISMDKSGVLCVSDISTLVAK